MRYTGSAIHYVVLALAGVCTVAVAGADAGASPKAATEPLMVGAEAVPWRGCSVAKGVVETTFDYSCRRVYIPALRRDGPALPDLPQI